MQSSESQEPSAISPADQGEAWIDRQLERLTPRQKLAQRLVVLPGVADDGRPDEDTRAALAAGLGVLHGLTGMSVSAAARYHVEVAGIADELGLPPALVSANLESGVGYTLGGGGTDFPYPRGIGHSDDAGLARRMAEEAAREARLAGFHWTFSPCVDVLTTPDDPILGVRAFGLEADRTAVLGVAQIRGYQDGGLLATAKHFPGHGDSAKDTHAEAAPLARTPEDHEHRHLPPFRAAIEAGVASVMVAHVALPGLGVPGPASLSPVVNRTWLRTELGYDGLVVTDSLRMGAIVAGWPTAASAVAALAAGADVANVKCPAGEVPSILDALEAALAAGELDGDELDRSVARLLRAKVRLGLHRAHGIDLARCEELDAGRSWADPGLAGTVSARLPDPVRGPVVVVGDSELARSLADGLKVARGEVAYEALSSPGEAARAHAGATVVAVTCPLPVDGGRDSAEFAASVEAARAHGHPVVAVVNSTVPATGLRVAGPAVSVPAVDAFGIVSGAAVGAAVEVLG
ncbi:glycoside hydrolase family 3 N-terminal domain-containing protein [Amycolatopsis mongoliensis]|uniref:beta-N-acetylhexosaminidase n=1 Tax=Amycolatopsis mongoliensis TaxID=715475 RepID=A0A9Y2JLS0_9PSEU|nr:glycoside hydrolase family 3 N-terminal domain-containing protein [Amycolatopsis sp. 4-36]WIY00956.1 glycoside hydrolase family 3 N-terminal domain-containing protein [Amycolatopsis sp. 4-36]